MILHKKDMDLTQLHRQTDGQTNKIIPIYPPNFFLQMGIKSHIYLLAVLTLTLTLSLSPHTCGLGPRILENKA